MLSTLQQAKLKKINKQLSNYGVEEIKESISEGTIQKLREHAESMRNTVMESSEFNSYHKNTDYAVSILVMEAIEILTNPEDDSPYINYIAEAKDKVKELESMYENYVRKNGDNKKAKELKGRINKIKSSIYESEASKKFETILKESAGKAQTIMSAKGLQDDMIDFQAKVGEIQNKYVDSFIAMVNDEYGAEMATDIQDRLMDSLDELMKMVRKTKTDMLTIVNILSGNEVGVDSMTDSDTIEGEESMVDELDLDLGSDEESASETDSEDKEESSDDELDLDLDLGSDDFERKE